MPLSGMPEIRVYIGFSGPSTGNVFTVGDPTLGQVGVVPIGADLTWVQIPSAQIKNWSVRFGASQGDNPTLRHDPATATVEFHDPFRHFDPENLAGPYVSAGRSQVEEMRRVKIVAVWNGISYAVFYGFTDEFKPNYNGNFWTTTVMTATDPSKVMAATNRDPIAPVGGGELGGARITRILDQIGWPASARVISTGNVAMQATTLEGNVLSELQQVQDTEGGQFFFDRLGRAVFRNRDHILTATRSKVVQVLFGDNPTGWAVSGEMPYADVEPTSGEDNVVNSISAQRVGGVEQTVENALSVAQYLRKNHTRSDLLHNSDADTLAWAQALLYRYATPARRFASISFIRPRPQVQNVYWPAILGRDLGDLITIRRRPKGGGAMISRDCFVRGMEYSSDGAVFNASFVLQSAERYAFFVVGDAVRGRVGLNAVS